MSAAYRVGGRSKPRVPRRVWLLLACLIAAIVIGVVAVRHIYYTDLSPVSNDETAQLVTIDEGSSVKQIADQLQKQHLIRSAWAMELYVHSQELNDQLQAGTYALSPSQSTLDIVGTMTKGKVATKLVTILPGKRIDQIRSDLINDGFSPSSVDAALQPDQYSDLPAVGYLPSSVDSLEGLLWPDSFEKDSATQPSLIIRESLTEMGQQLTPSLQAAFANEGLTVYQGLTLASIVTQEVSKPADQAQVAQVFLSRLKTNMMLGSDVTADYGAIEAGHAPNLNFDSPYNTLLHTGLPPSPISTVTANALNAVAHPATTNWLYFVTGDDGTTHFSTNLQQHQQQTAQFCHKLCAQE